MVSTFAARRDSLRKTLFLLHAPQRRNTAPTTPSAETGKHCGVRTKKSPRVTVREVRPNPSFNRSPNGIAPGPRAGIAYHPARGPGAIPLVSA